MKKYNLDEKYSIYRKWYYEQEAKLARNGQSMFSPMYTKNQFRNVYDETKAELKMLKDNGNRKGVGNVYQYIAREQAYPISYGMEKGLRDLYKQAGVKKNWTRSTTYEDIRKNAPDAVWDLVRNEYDNLKMMGISGKNAKLMISQMFFGSD